MGVQDGRSGIHLLLQFQGVGVAVGGAEMMLELLQMNCTDVADWMMWLQIDCFLGTE
jgi:hypothetical protein